VGSLMPIGSFARASRISVKALRFYDAQGLLVPAHVDDSSGYRYYLADQLRSAEAIRALRMVDMSIEQIRDVLDAEDPHAVRGALDEHRSRLQGRLADQERMLRFLDKLINYKEIAMPYEVETKQVPSVRVVSHTVHTELRGVGEAIGQGFGAAHAAAVAAGHAIVGPPFVVYHQLLDESTPGDLEMCVPVPPGAEGPVEGPLGTVAWKDLPAAEVATTVHAGPYIEIGPAYEALERWIQEHGREVVGPPAEIYLNDPSEVADGEQLTEVRFPLAWT